MSVDVRHRLEPGALLGGRYRIGAVIGQGGMGAVYEAEQVDLGRRVAVKVLFGVEASAVARFRREASATASLRSPHVVAVLDFQSPPGEPPFLVMERLEGASLHAVLAHEGRLDPTRAARIASHMLEALDVAHGAGLVHRDVKPSNVWLSRTLTSEIGKLLDFGIVKDVTAPIGQTTQGVLVGTPSYLAPEQIRGLPADARSDVHGVGVVLFEMLSGARPWNPASLFVDIVTRIPLRVSSLAPGIPEGLADVVARALAKDPDARFRSAAEMLAALAPFVQGGGAAAYGPPHIAPYAAPPTIPVSAAPPPAPVPLSFTPAHAPATSRGTFALFALVAGAVVVVGGLVAAGAFVFLRGRPPAALSPALEAPPLAPTPGPTAQASTPAMASSVTPSRPVARPPSARPSPSAAPGAPPASPSAPPMPAPSAPSGPTTRSRCVARFGIMKTVCPTPSVPSCQCVVPRKAGQRVCSVPLSAGPKCFDDDDTRRGYSGPGKRDGEACRGYLDEGTAPGILSSGSLECDVCRGAEMYSQAVPGTPCRGTSKQGEVASGVWIADP